MTPACWCPMIKPKAALACALFPSLYLPPHPRQELTGLWESRIQGVLPDGECEVLYGRAGYLYSLTWLQQQLGRDLIPQQLIKVCKGCLLPRGGWRGGGGGGLFPDWVGRLLQPAWRQQ
jgi:hypothetical protein